MSALDVRAIGVGRSFDIFMYVLYSGDQIFIKDMVTQACTEVAEENQCDELFRVLEHTDNLLLYKCLFFLLIDFHQPFRQWAIEQGPSMGLQPVCPLKIHRFLQILRSELVPNFLVNESMRLDDFERVLKVEYIRS